LRLTAGGDILLLRTGFAVYEPHDIQTIRAMLGSEPTTMSVPDTPEQDGGDGSAATDCYDARRLAAIEALHQLACHDGHHHARRAIVEWMDDYIEAGHLALITELSASLQKKFTRSENIETLPA